MTQRSSNNPGEDRPKKRRIEFRRNRLRPARRKNWDLSVEEDNKADLATTGRESVKAKGDLSRKRTVMESGDETGIEGGELVQGTAIADRGQYVDVDDGRRV